VQGLVAVVSLQPKLKLMLPLPLYIHFLFGATTVLTVFFFYKAAPSSKTTLVLLVGWMLLQMLIGLSGFYTNTSNVPPRFALMVLPPFLTIALLFATQRGRHYIDQLNVKTLTLLHLVRIPVEVVLFWLFLHKAVPQLMTFEGRNFDILSGLTAPLVYYLAFVRKSLGRKGLLLWNVACLALLVNIVGTAVLSLPTPFQKLAFEQPNVGVLYVPFVWLPSVVVPLVLLSHLASIRHLLKMKTTLVPTAAKAAAIKTIKA
jgi:hypothetical protein